LVSRETEEWGERGVPNITPGCRTSRKVIQITGTESRWGGAGRPGTVKGFRKKVMRKQRGKEAERYRCDSITGELARKREANMNLVGISFK